MHAARSSRPDDDPRSGGASPATSWSGACGGTSTVASGDRWGAAPFLAPLPHATKARATKTELSLTPRSLSSRALAGELRPTLDDRRRFGRLLDEGASARTFRERIRLFTMERRVQALLLVFL